MSKKDIQISKPNADEYPAYAAMYIKWLPDDGRILQHMRDQVAKTGQLVSGIPDEKWNYVYAPGKWTIKEVLVHIIDDERIYAYRALRFGRKGTANNNVSSVRGLLYHLAGHELHHLEIIKEKYLSV